MEDILARYALPYDPKEPMLCFDEKSKELRSDARTKIDAKAGRVQRRDYEYVRNGTANIFMTVEPKGGYRTPRVTARRTRDDFAREIKRVTDLPRYKKARKIHIVLDNLNTHCEKSLIEAFGAKETARIMRRVRFHHTPKHASWLNMAEIELSAMDRQCTKKRIGSAKNLSEELAAWRTRRNAAKAQIRWKFTVEDARKLFKYEGQN
jgi:hypothetical protein